MADQNIQELFEKIATDGVWQAKYGAVSPITYNFISRRDAVARLLVGSHFKSVLDLGCGSGDYFELLTGIAEQYTGIDFSPQMIADARGSHDLTGTRNQFIVGSAEALPLDDDSCDLVCAIGFIEYFADPHPPLQEILRVLKPAGTVIIQSYQMSIYRSLLVKSGLRALKRMGKRAWYAINAKGQPSIIIDKPYLKFELDELMAKCGLFRVAHAYSNYSIFPRWFQLLFPKVYIGMSEKMATTNPDTYGRLAINYIGRYALE